MEEGLLIRPSLVGGWWCAKWKGVTGDNKAYCHLDVIGEGKNIDEAVQNYFKRKGCNHQFITAINTDYNECLICGMLIKKRGQDD